MMLLLKSKMELVELIILIKKSNDEIGKVVDSFNLYIASLKTSTY